MLSVRGLSVRFLMPGGRRVAAVTDARFDVAPGACLTLIGESGCGKSVPASSLIGLLPGNAWTAELVPAVGLTPDLLTTRPHEVSDGRLQRACLARALVLRPRLLVCDEMTAMLDASTGAALVGAVESYRSANGAALPAVGHDRILLERWCDGTVHWDGPA